MEVSKYISTYLQIYNKRAYLLGIRNSSFIKKYFMRKTIADSNCKNLNDLIFIFLIIFSFIIFQKVVKFKAENKKIQYKQLELLFFLFSVCLFII